LRLGILGGSFDPPHLGHLHVARAAHEELELDQVRLVPALRPPHKRERALAPDADRVAMLGKLAALEPWLAVDRRELDRGGTSFTYDTLAGLRRELGDAAKLFFLLGSDSLADLPSWHRAAEIVQLATIVTVPRESMSVELARSSVRAALPRSADAILAHVLDVEPLPISSSSIRARVRAGLPIDELVPRAIADYVRERGLYRASASAA
jgi:nicotinate-nucleotide adenylyltransferase